MDIERVESALLDYKIVAHVISVTTGNSVTTYEIKLEAGSKLNTLKARLDDIALSLETRSVRLLRTDSLYLEVANKERLPVLFTQINDTSKHLNAVLGLDMINNVITDSVRTFPHLLIAGTTGSGKSVLLHTIISSLLRKNKPSQLQLLLIDPKKTELTYYQDCPHLISKVVTDVPTAAGALKAMVNEMETRYSLMEAFKTRDISTLNKPIIIIIIDELADLMLSMDSLIRNDLILLAQKARACGIHIIAATQRPSREVVTGLVKANFPSRICLRVSSGIDSRVVLDTMGGEKLLGNGDALYMRNGKDMLRLQCPFVSEADIIQTATNTLKDKRINHLVVFAPIFNEDLYTTKKKEKEPKPVKEVKRKSILKWIIGAIVITTIALFVHIWKIATSSLNNTGKVRY